MSIGISLAAMAVWSGGSAESSDRPTVDDRSGFLRGSEEGDEPDLEQLMSDEYLQRSYPLDGTAYERTAAALGVFQSLPFRVPRPQATRAASPLLIPRTWRSLGPFVAKSLPADFSANAYDVRPSTVSGRALTLLTGRTCKPGNCRLWVGTAGGGVFRTDDALAAEPAWSSRSAGLTTGSIGSLASDPNDPSGNTIYAGTGEPHLAAGVGVFRSTDGGDSWAILTGSIAVASGAAVSDIVVDPRNPRVITISTARSFHGVSSVWGGHAIPPNAPTFGVYRSRDGGASFSLLLSLPDESGRYTSTTKSVTQIGIDPNDPETLYAAVAGEGLHRSSPKLDGDSAFRRIFSFRGDEAGEEARVEFALVDLGSRTRIYLGSANDDAEVQALWTVNGVANLYRTNHALRPAEALLNGWTLLSSRTPGTPGYASFRYCQEACVFNSVVVSPPGRPNEVWLGGQFDYEEAWWGISAGRAVQRSTDAGKSFSDLTSDARDPPFQLHPDTHEIVFAPGDSRVSFIASDGGVVRTSGRYGSAVARCPAARDVGAENAALCRRRLQRVPTRIESLNSGLDTLQLQSASTSPNPRVDAILIGTQDNGTWMYSPERGWTSVATGDGGQSGIDAENPEIRFHTYHGPYVRINHASGDPDAWRSIDGPLTDDEGRPKEHVSFYMPIIPDPVVGGTIYLGMQHVWRTKRSGGDRERIIRLCGSDSPPPACGDWVPLGADLTSTEFGDDRRDGCDGPEDEARRRCYIVAVERASSDSRTLWAATYHGRLFVSKNADGPPRSVLFQRLDIPTGTPGVLSTPGRFISGIAIDDGDPDRAWISYSGYDAHTPGDERGHVFEVVFDPGTGMAQWTNRTYNLGDAPITDVVRHAATGDLYAATDFGVIRLVSGATAWTEAAQGLPLVAVYGLTVSPDGRRLYAATHGRGLWELSLPT